MTMKWSHDSSPRWLTWACGDAAMIDRPAQLVVVVGTATEIGKTWVTCQLIRRLRAPEVLVSARKPAQSFEPGVGPAALDTDADLLADATGEPVAEVCPPHRWYDTAMAPPMAAASLGRSPFTGDDLIAELMWPPGIHVGFVETAGGVCSPFADDVDSAEFARLVEPDHTILVADAGLGTISAVRLALRALAPLDTVVFLNRYDATDELHQRNRDWLTDRDGCQTYTDIAELTTHLAAAGQ
jgi:dethiobiotin synthetase